MSQEIDKYLRLIGIESPNNEIENSIFISANSVSEIKIDLDKKDPFTILAEIKEEEKKAKINRTNKKEYGI